MRFSLPRTAVPPRANSRPGRSVRPGAARFQPLPAAIAGAAFLALICAPRPAPAQWQTQTLVLTQGWNSVFLTVTPSPSACDELFSGRPRIKSVRRWAPRSPDDMIYDEAAGTALPAGGSWLAWYPTNSPNRPLLSMTQMNGAAAYLIELTSGPRITLAIIGRPVAFLPAWTAGAHHFTGLPAPTNPPTTFATFFAPVTNEIPVDFRLGGEIYRVLSDGSHQRIYQPALTDVRRGEAYWIKAANRLEYGGPLAVQVEAPEGWIEFTRRLVPQYVTLRNDSGAPLLARLRQLPSEPPPPHEPGNAGLVPLRYAVVTPQEGLLGRAYAPLPSLWSTQLQAGASVRLALLPDAAQMTSSDTNKAYQCLLEASDGNGAVLQYFGVRAQTRPGAVADAQGLWVGEATITDVGRLEMLGVKGAIPAAPVPVARPFSFRLLAHVDSNGVCRLLQRALVGTRYDPQTAQVLTDLLADEAKVAAYQSAHPDGKIFRVSSANFPFMNPVPLSGGSFGVPYQTLRGTVNIPRSDPVNPFLHAFAPMHDNLEQRAENRVPYADDVEVYSIRRDLELLFQPPDESDPDPRWGETVCGGIYREEIYGLGGPLNASNRLIKVKGHFRLQRSIANGVLVQ